MAEGGLSRSSLEAYSAICLGLLTVMFPMTWWLCLKCTSIICGLAVDVCLRANFYPNFRDFHRHTVAVMAVIFISVAGITRAAYMYAEDGNRDENYKTGSYPEVSFSLMRGGEVYRPTLTYKPMGGSLVNYNIIFGGIISDHILTFDEESTYLNNDKYINQIEDESKRSGSDNISNIIPESEQHQIQNPGIVISQAKFNELILKRSFIYMFLFFNYRTAIRKRPYFARFCTRLIPDANASVPCLHADFVKSEYIRGH